MILFIKNNWGRILEYTFLLAIIGLLVYTIVSKDLLSSYKENESELTKSDIELWVSIDGKFIVQEKKTGKYTIFSSELSTDLMLMKLKFYYVEDLRKLGKLSEIENIENFFKRKQ